MADLRFETPETTDKFRAVVDAQLAPLPWSSTQEGTVFDADGGLVLQVDPDNQRPNRQVSEIAGWLVCAVNTCGGFQAELAPSPLERTCPGCGKEIDPDTCHCGDPIDGHGVMSGHSPVPMGCVCGYPSTSTPDAE